MFLVMKKYFLSLLILLLFTFSTKVIAQKNVQAKIDSLESVLKTSIKDTNRVNTLLNLCAAYQQTDPNKVDFYLKEATQLSNELKAPKQVAECFFTQGLYEYGKGNFAAAKKITKKHLLCLNKKKIKLEQLR